MAEIKTCIRCNTLLSIDNFCFRKDSQKYRNECKKCLVELFKIRMNKNPGKIKEIAKKTREKNKHKTKGRMDKWKELNPNYRKEYVKKNKQLISDIQKRSNEKNKQALSIKSKIYYKENKEKHKKWSADYALKNKEKLLAARRIWEKNKIESDSNYLMQKKLRSRVRMAMKCSGLKKSKRTEDLIGCSIVELRSYIQNVFEDGMTWDNWSQRGWHIDHKIPISWFNLKNESCMMKAFHFTNMKPMWAKENILKSNNYSDKLNLETWTR